MRVLAVTKTMLIAIETAGPRESTGIGRR